MRMVRRMGMVGMVLCHHRPICLLHDRQSEKLGTHLEDEVGMSLGRHALCIVLWQSVLCRLTCARGCRRSTTQRRKRRRNGQNHKRWLFHLKYPQANPRRRSVEGKRGKGHVQLCRGNTGPPLVRN